MGKTKGELIENQLKKIEELCISEKFPFLAKVEELRNKYTLTQITALCERFLVPAKDCLSGYFDSEIEKIQLVIAASGEPEAEEMIQFKITAVQKEALLKCFKMIIRIIEI